MTDSKPHNIVIGQKVTAAKVPAARNMRREMSPVERMLWSRLRRNQLGGFHFRRQQVISGFIADFYCHQAGLAVEVDGPSHTDPEYDKARDAVFETLGIRVVRVTNEQVVHQIEDVLEYILPRLRERTAPQLTAP